MTSTQTTEEWLLDYYGPGNPAATDLGHDHWTKPWVYGSGGVPGGVHVLHPKGPIVSGAYADSRYCLGSIAFDLPAAADHGHTGAVWQVQSMDPLTVSPSLACDCGDHGFIREGKWVPA